MQNKHNPKNSESIRKMAGDIELQKAARIAFDRSCEYNYSYNFTWLGRPIIQFPQDIIAIQEIIWSVKPDLIVETGIAHGGSLILSASILEMIGGDGDVVGIDIDIRSHNLKVIKEHFLYKRITLVEGSSVDSNVADKIYDLAKGYDSIMVFLDSNHTHEHVAKELQLYSPLVTKGSYLVVLDTVIEDMSKDAFQDREWGRGNNPKTAVHEFLESDSRFVIDEEIHNKLLFTVAPDGYLKCVED